METDPTMTIFAKDLSNAAHTTKSLNLKPGEKICWKTIPTCAILEQIDLCLLLFVQVLREVIDNRPEINCNNVECYIIASTVPEVVRIEPVGGNPDKYGLVRNKTVKFVTVDTAKTLKSTSTCMVFDLTGKGENTELVRSAGFAMTLNGAAGYKPVVKI